MIKRHWFTLGMIIAIPMGLYFYKAGEFLFPNSSYITFLAMYFTGLNLDLKYFSFKKNIILSIALSSLINCLLSPIIFYFFGKLFLHSNSDIFVGLIVLSVLPTTLISHIVICQEAGGNSLLSAFCTISSNILSILFIPFFLNIFLDVYIQLSYMELFIRLVLVVILPVAIAQIIKRFFKKVILRYKWLYPKAAQTFVLIFVFISISINQSHFMRIYYFAYEFIILIFTVILLHFILLILSYLTAKIIKLSKEDSISLLFSASQKTLAVGIAILADAIPNGEKGALAIISYHFFQILFDNYIATRISIMKSRFL